MFTLPSLSVTFFSPFSYTFPLPYLPFRPVILFTYSLLIFHLTFIFPYMYFLFLSFISSSHSTFLSSHSYTYLPFHSFPLLILLSYSLSSLSFTPLCHLFPFPLLLLSFFPSHPFFLFTTSLSSPHFVSLSSLSFRFPSQDPCNLFPLFFSFLSSFCLLPLPFRDLPSPGLLLVGEEEEEEEERK